MNFEEMLRIFRRLKFEAILQVMRVVVKHQKGQKQLKKTINFRKLRWPNHLSTTESTLNSTRMLLRQPIGKHEAQFTFIVQPNIKNFEGSPKVKGTYFAKNVGNQSISKGHSQSTLESILTAKHFIYSVPQRM